MLNATMNARLTIMYSLHYVTFTAWINYVQC